MDADVVQLWPVMLEVTRPILMMLGTTGPTLKDVLVGGHVVILGLILQACASFL